MLLQIDNYVSDYATVEYFANYNVAFLSWRGEAHSEDYRKPLEFTMRLLNFNRGSSFILDMTHCFYESPDDLQWTFETVLPAIFRSGCDRFIFITKDINDLNNNNDLWIEHAKRFFRVNVVHSFDYAIGALSDY